MDFLISKLLKYGLDHSLIGPYDIDYAANLLLDLFALDSFELQAIDEPITTNHDIIDAMLEYAIDHHLLDNNVTERDLFDTRIMNCLMPRQSEVIRNFFELYQDEPVLATDYFYNLSIASNYIRKNRTDRNIRFKHNYKYGNFEITINLSKPEKDPKEIAAAKSLKSSGYPKCLLCKENVGFAGNLNHPARQTHRIIPLTLNDHGYYLQYSPYVYYDEHCIILNTDHVPMRIDRDTFVCLLDFVDQFPHYMIGSNADLPIVGGSILSHDHFQGGRYHFPIEDAKIIRSYTFENYPNSQIEILNWPLSTIRITSSNREEVLDFAAKTLAKWKQYGNVELDILPYSLDTRHNTITPISRMHDGKYQLDLVLRNNRTSPLYPDGIFHPHQEHHAVKKENIGLIEVMGLAVLPARLKEELSLLKECLLNDLKIDDIDVLAKHKPWYEEITRNYEISWANIDAVVEEALTVKFVNVLEDCGVFKMDTKGIEAFCQFVSRLDS
ncbi:MAG: UDP-glucose--hexose-1-phosphate uridylyltransferase [Erysipelotrichaceae bacterium]|nr:UDP-glucose--hexose-1-phosphate uridylyltransferase [Erysipelotrichaceae bacterium]